MSGTKTHIAETWPCGCVIARYVFGKHVITRCETHTRHPHSFELPRSWSTQSVAAGKEPT